MHARSLCYNADSQCRHGEAVCAFRARQGTGRGIIVTASSCDRCDRFFMCACMCFSCSGRKGQDNVGFGDHPGRAQRQRGADPPSAPPGRVGYDDDPDDIFLKAVLACQAGGGGTIVRRYIVDKGGLGFGRRNIGFQTHDLSFSSSTHALGQN